MTIKLGRNYKIDPKTGKVIKVQYARDASHAIAMRQSKKQTPVRRIPGK